MKTGYVKNKYNSDIPNKYGCEYEYNRWFKTPILNAGYRMTKWAIEGNFLNKINLDFSRYFELGPGAGTWTKLFLDKNNKADFFLLDISSEMLKLSKKSLDEYDQKIYFREGDFLEYYSDEKFDVFFSSRVIEYIFDKKQVVRKIYQLLNNGGEGFLITKTPKYGRDKILGRRTSKFHSGQIEASKLVEIFKELGFIEVKVYPVTMSFPVLKLAWLNILLYKIFGQFELNFVSQFFAESYCISFKKK